MESQEGWTVKNWITSSKTHKVLNFVGKSIICEVQFRGRKVQSNNKVDFLRLLWRRVQMGCLYGLLSLWHRDQGGSFSYIAKSQKLTNKSQISGKKLLAQRMKIHNRSVGFIYRIIAIRHK